MSKVIFVYGTLKNGFNNHRFISSQRYLGVAVTAPTYALYRYGIYPALVESDLSLRENLDPPNFCRIHGELYEVDDMAILDIDKLEGVSSGLFERKAIDIESHNLSKLPWFQSSFNALLNGGVEAYFFRRSLNGAANCGGFWGIR